MTGALLIVKYYVLGIIWGNESRYLDMSTCLHIYDLHGLDENWIKSSSGTAVLVKLDTLHSLENYIRSVNSVLSSAGHKS